MALNSSVRRLTRDFASFLRHELAQPDNPCAGQIRHAYAFGASQSGAYLRQFLYLGLNQDERERPVFDGYLIHIAGGGRGNCAQCHSGS